MKQTKFGFIPLAAWEQNLAGCADAFPRAVTVGSAKVVSYYHNTGFLTGDAKRVGALALASGLTLVENRDAQTIIAAIEAGLTEIYNCDKTTAQGVATHFSDEEIPWP